MGELTQQNIYIVDNVAFTLNDIAKDDATKKIEFSELTTISGDRLPIFKKPPFILVVSNEGADFYVKNVTTSSFLLQAFSTPGDTKGLRVTLFITQNP